jgi:hypothetical protein
MGMPNGALYFATGPHEQPWNTPLSNWCFSRKPPTRGSNQYLHLPSNSITTIPSTSMTALAATTELSHSTPKSPQRASIFSNPTPRAMFSLCHGLPPARGIALHNNVRPFGRRLIMRNAFCNPASARRSSSIASLMTSQPSLYLDDRPNRLSRPQHHAMITRSRRVAAAIDLTRLSAEA